MFYLADDPLSIVLEYLPMEELIAFAKKYFDEKVVKTVIQKYSRKLNHSITVKEFIWIFENTFNLKEISKTQSTSNFRVTLKQLKDCKYVKKPMNVFTGMGSKKIIATMFDLKDIIKLSIERHKSITNLIEYNKKLSNRRIKKHERLAKEKEERRELLILKLSEMKIDLQEDNFFCYSYIQKNKFPIESVIKNLAQEKYIYEYCDVEEAYNKIISNIYPFLEINILNQMINTEALLNTPFKDFPPDWPWLHGITPETWHNRFVKLTDNMSNNEMFSVLIS